jgi:hypothetical protein
MTPLRTQAFVQELRSAASDDDVDRTRDLVLALEDYLGSGTGLSDEVVAVLIELSGSANFRASSVPAWLLNVFEFYASRLTTEQKARALRHVKGLQGKFSNAHSSQVVAELVEQDWLR